VKKTPECQVKKTPERVRWIRLQRGSSKEDSREGHVKKTPVDGRAKKTPERVRWRRLQSGSSEDDSSRGSSKEDRSVLPSGKTPHDINSVIVWLQLKSVQESEGLRPRLTDWLNCWLTECQLQSNSAQCYIFLRFLVYLRIISKCVGPIASNGMVIMNCRWHQMKWL